MLRRAPRPVVRPAVTEGYEELPRHWWFDSVLVSHRVNALNLLFPAGERFFIRSVRRYLDRVSDPELRERVRAFAGQEAQHGRAHEAAFAALEAQGFEIRDFLAWYEWLAYEVIEPNTPDLLHLSATVALEHFTATMAEDALGTDLLDGAHPLMRDLLRWHASEEIEHRSVAFDVLQEVDDRYLVRLAGLVVATITLLMFWEVGSRHLLKQDPAATRERLRREQVEALGRGQSRDFVRRSILSYLRPGFHPEDRPTRGLAERWLAMNRPAREVARAG
ncbi:MAG TPA: metal-dependent hydrolase [Myxococcota bacterium]|nr:metal-dependent hydrolase [Myxococcota bacterium]